MLRGVFFRHFVVLLGLVLFTKFGYSFVDKCFCKSKDEIVTCDCDTGSIDVFNSKKVIPLLSKLIKKDYFRYYKVNIFRSCPFEQNASSGKCSSRSCAVNECTQDQLPAGLKQNHSHEKNKYSKDESTKSSTSSEGGASCPQKPDESLEKFGKIDVHLSNENQEAFETWTRHDDMQDNFCELDDLASPDAVYYDLVLNPERFTGYTGPSAVNVWKLIYDQNCFKPEQLGYMPNEAGMCLEKKTFYRLISGFHTSINVDVTANWIVPPQTAFESPQWGPNLKEFVKRFDPKSTWGEGPERLKNMYFAYLVEMRALVKAAPYLKQGNYYTGNEKEDTEVKELVSQLLDNLKLLPEQFDENKLFQGDFKKLKEDFKVHFRNISGILDCVGCDKCRLWGKVQFTGMGTALKILFSGDSGPHSTISKGDISNFMPFQLTRGEIVALINAFAKLSASIEEVTMFRHMMN